MLQVVVVIPEVPGFAGDITNETSIKTILAAQWRTINRGGESIYEKIRAAGFDPYIHFVASLSFPNPMLGWITFDSTI